MVQRTFRKQIVFGPVVFGVIGVVFSILSFQPSATNSSYSASGPALDLAVLDGIVAADKNDTSQKNNTGVKAVVVPHHLVATKSIALSIKALVPFSPKRIVVISPDHFARCPTLLCTTQGTYKTFFGDVSISRKDIDLLGKSSDLVSNSSLFALEHGIYTIVPFIKHYLPDAEIIPVVISQKTRGTDQSRTEVLKILKPLLEEKDTALVISSDFSHYLPLAESNEMDVKTQNSFCSGESKEILMLRNPNQSDCPLCLWVLEQEAQELGFWNPNLVAHTNSATLLKDTSVKETTSHFTFTFSVASSTRSCPLLVDNSQVISSQANIAVVGDMMFDRYIRHVSNKHNSDFPFSCIDPLLKKADFVIGNLEGPITSQPSLSEGTTIGSKENYFFTFPPTTADVLFRHNIKVVSIGNNHINNQGPDGILSTKKYLTNSSVAFFGGLRGDTNVYRMTTNGVDISFINYNQFGGDSQEIIAQLIKIEHNLNRIVIVYAHWGEEYKDVPQYVHDVATLFAQNGADIIIGSHPHVIQSHEMIGNTLVYYSLGNFIFDQYFDSKVTEGLFLLVHISGHKINVEENMVSLNTDGRTCLKK